MQRLVLQSNTSQTYKHTYNNIINILKKQNITDAIKVPLEKEIATHSSILAWEAPWWAAVHGTAKVSDTPQRLNNKELSRLGFFLFSLVQVAKSHISQHSPDIHILCEWRKNSEVKVGC